MSDIEGSGMFQDVIRRWADQWQYVFPEEARVQLAEDLKQAQETFTAALSPVPAPRGVA